MRHESLSVELAAERVERFADLIEFGTSFCIFALAADDFDEYVSFREEAIGQSESELNGTELTLAVDGAVQVFCPDEALRLGIGQ